MNGRSLAALVLALIVSGGAAAQEPTSVGEAAMLALDGELGLHPEMGVTDIYKFIHQGVYGPGHAVQDREAAARYLADEMATLGSAEPTDPLCQPLGGDPAMVRIHLQPFAAAGGDPAVLLEAFVTSGDAVTGDPAVMDAVLASAVSRLVRRGRFQLAGQLEDLSGRLAEDGYPPVHHSDGYVARYRPAYRVVLLELAQQQGWCE